MPVLVLHISSGFAASFDVSLKSSALLSWFEPSWQLSAAAFHSLPTPRVGKEKKGRGKATWVKSGLPEATWVT